MAIKKVRKNVVKPDEMKVELRAAHASSFRETIIIATFLYIHLLRPIFYGLIYF